MIAGSAARTGSDSQPRRPLRILIVTDAWAPQVNGVVRTLEILGRELRALGYDVHYATPEGRFTLPMPTYPEIRLSVFSRATLRKEIADYAPDTVHIATEGPLGLAARRICLQGKIPFSTSYHTRFPDYVRARLPFVPESVVYRFLRWFHSPATAMMVATPALQREMRGHGFTNLRIWSRGVDIEQFHPIADAALPYPRPVWLYVGRIAVEKDLEAFLTLNLRGTKVLAGDGPARRELERRFAEAKFLGAKSGEELTRIYAASDVFVFPSRTDTFGLVLLEALACGTPVAALPVQGPIDVLGDSPVAVLDEDLGSACTRALDIPRQACRDYALRRSWRVCTLQFLANIGAGAKELSGPS